jgi:transposase-like protein
MDNLLFAMWSPKKIFKSATVIPRATSQYYRPACAGISVHFAVESVSSLVWNTHYPPEIRKVIYTTNAIESINMSLRKVIKTRSSFPTDEAVTKLFYLALRNISKKWTMPIRDWKAALNRFSIQFEERILPS